MNFDFDINDLTFEEVYRILIDSFELKTKEFDLRKKELDHSILNRSVLTIDDVKDYFDFDNENGIYTFPYLDEREIKNNSFLGMEVFPFKEFYWYIDSKVNERFYGLVDVEFSINKITLKRNDERFENIETVFKDVKSFYFDYENKKYIQINKNGKNEFTEEYLRREEQYFLTLSVIEKEMMDYLIRLEKYQKIFLQIPGNFKETQRYFNFLQEYIEKEFKFIHLKVLLKKIDLNHYRGLKSFVEGSKGFLEGFKKTIVNLSEEELNLRFSDFPERSQEVQKNNDFILKKVIPMFERRDVQKIRKGKILKKQGYFQYGSKIYENFVYLEFENLRKSYPDSFEMRKKEKDEIEKSLENINEFEQDEKDILTIEEWKEIEETPRLERRFVIVGILNKKVSNGEISRSELRIIMEDILSKFENKTE